MRCLLFVALAGCLGDMPSPAPIASHPAAAAHAGPMRTSIAAETNLAGAATPSDGGVVTAQPDLSPAPPSDLAPSDLAGLTDCYGVAYCDSTNMFCLRYFKGTPGEPGPIKVAPSCFSPTDPCAGGTLDCACIQADTTLGPACQQCFDNMDGTFTCYTG